MLRPEIKFKRVQNIFRSILALILAKVRDKNRKKRKIQFFGTPLKCKLATLLLSRLLSIILLVIRIFAYFLLEMASFKNRQLSFVLKKHFNRMFRKKKGGKPFACEEVEII